MNDFLKLVAGIIATLIAAGIVGLTTITLSTASKVDVLVEKASTADKRLTRIEERQIDAAKVK